MYTIITTPHPLLVKKAGRVKHFDKKLKDILSSMEETLLATTDPVGVGLAAPQVGISMAIFQMKPKDSAPVTSFVNPEIIPQVNADGASADQRGNLRGSVLSSARIRGSKKKGKLLEGCLSVPNIWGHVTRKKEITITWQDENGHKHKKMFKGFPAVIVQHEMDHLQGVLFTKHVIDQEEKLYKSHKNEKGEDEFDEIKI